MSLLLGTPFGRDATSNQCNIGVCVCVLTSAMLKSVCCVVVRSMRKIACAQCRTTLKIYI